MSQRNIRHTLAEALSEYPSYEVRIWVAGTYLKVDRSEFAHGMKPRIAKYPVDVDHDCNEIELGCLFEPECV